MVTCAEDRLHFCLNDLTFSINMKLTVKYWNHCIHDITASCISSPFTTKFMIICCLIVVIVIAIQVKYNT